MATDPKSRVIGCEIVKKTLGVPSTSLVRRGLRSIAKHFIKIRTSSFGKLLSCNLGYWEYHNIVCHDAYHAMLYEMRNPMILIIFYYNSCLILKQHPIGALKKTFPHLNNTFPCVIDLIIWIQFTNLNLQGVTNVPINESYAR